MPILPRDVLPLTLPSVDARHTAYDTYRQSGGAPGIGAITWGAAFLAVLIPFQIPFAYPVKRWFWATGTTVSGSVQFGIYTQNYERVFRTGSGATGVTQTGTASAQLYTTVTDFVIPPMSGYMVMSLSATTAGLTRGLTAGTTLQLRLAGLYQATQASLDLPATITPAAYAQTYWPLFGVTRTDSGN
jgi:hypothetical protein